MDWITLVFLEVVWRKYRPDVSILFYGEPDSTSHFHDTASEVIRSIIAHCDRQFGRVLDWWDAEGRAGSVQIIAVSDHGHITGHSVVSVIDSTLNTRWDVYGALLKGAMVNGWHSLRFRSTAAT